MNRIAIVLFCGLAIASSPAFSQTERGSWELSLGGNIGSYSVPSEFTGGGYASSNESEAVMYLALDVRAGGYVADGFSLEPEIYLLAVQGAPPIVNMGGNAAYTFTIPESIVKPFLVAGYGIGNGVPLMQRMSGRMSDALDIPVLRVGGGLKVFLSRNVALKAEYRYEQYTIESNDAGAFYSYSSKETMRFHNILFGFSVFLPGGN